MNSNQFSAKRDERMTVDSRKFRDNMRGYLDDVFNNNESLVIKRSGIPIAVVVSYHEWQKLQKPEPAKEVEKL